jgi:MFS family permease
LPLLDPEESAICRSVSGDPFLAIYLLELGFSYAQIGSLLGCQRLVTAVLEIPSGVGADRWGRRRVLAGSFAMHALGLGVLGFGATSSSSPGLPWFYVGLSIFGVGEALRTGSHKAIMLDYLEYNGEGQRATAVVSLTRMYSKVSSALAGACAGGLLFVFHDYAALFWLSAAAAAAGFVLILSYPQYLEGECRRGPTVDAEGFLEREGKLMTMIRNMRLWPPMLSSILYESQVEIVLKMFLQPFLRLGLDAAGIALVPTSGVASVRGTGALVVGGNELFRDGLGAIGARGSADFERVVNGQERALQLLYVATGLVILLVGLSAIDVGAWFWPGLVGVGLVTMLQNLRRPIYVSYLNTVSNKPLRATILSIDNQATSFATALLMPLMGLAADRWGLWIIGVLCCALMSPELALRRRRKVQAATGT